LRPGIFLEAWEVAEDHVKQLSAARERLVADRRKLAEVLASPKEGRHADNMRDRFVAIQATIEAIDHAIQDEQPAKKPAVTAPRLVPK
jgi:hypothetical protein